MAHTFRQLRLYFALLAASLFAQSSAAAPVDFAKDIWPVLEERCIRCHSGDKPKARLRLDSRGAMLTGGESGPAIVPGKSAASSIIERVSTADADLRMPPKGDRLADKQVALLREWIDGGATWPDGIGARTTNQPHWSLKPLIKTNPLQASGNPIDGYIDAKLQPLRLRRSPPADPRTLIRRLTFDLTGLPPTPQEIAAFVKESDAESTRFAAYEKLVDRLLASPRYGEHWARHWLDVVHYADTHGNDHDHFRPNAWPYRDYVIASLNSDKPYARFVQEQVAGDVLFPDDPQATVALGFLAAGPWDDTLMATIREDTVDHRMGQNLDRDNIVSTVMSTFQSLTVHCARCHNHKFDPISQREYYALQAVFAGIDRADRPYDTDATTLARRKELQSRKRALEARDPALLASLDSPEVEAKGAAFVAAVRQRDERWKALDVINVGSTTSDDTLFARQEDGSWFVSGARPDKDTFIITAQSKLTGIRAIRLEVLPDKRLPQGGPGRYDNGNFHLAQFRATAQPSQGETKGAAKLVFTRAVADHSDGGDVVANTLDGKPETFWSIHPQYNQPHEAVFELKEPVGFDVGTTLTLSLDFTGKTGHQIGRFRLFVSTEAPDAVGHVPVPAAIAAVLRIAEKDRTPERRRELALYVLSVEIERGLAALPPPKYVYAATRDFTPQGSFKPTLKPRPIHLLARGDITKPGELVGPASLGCMPGLPASLDIPNLEDESLRRAALARWLTDDRNVLTWRSIVNRVWHYHFGRGICDTPNDFGVMGSAPTHPELLDHLALWFRDDAKGSIKALHRLIVTSETYRQGSGTRHEGTQALRPDSDNRLLSSFPRSRLTGEMVRDAALQMSGRLDLRMGGPADVQFNHKGEANTFMPADGSPPFVDYEHFDVDAAENNRRAVYRFVFRTVPDPLMDALDCPDGGAMTPVRTVSTTALQALAMLNNAFLIRQCEHIAARIAKTASSPQEQTAAAFLLMLQRPPREHEVNRFTAYIERHGLANACHVLLNSNEFLYVD